MSSETKYVLMGAGVGAVIGAGIGYKLAPNEKERNRYVLCGAIAGAAIGALIVSKAQENNLANDCYQNFDLNRCLVNTIETVKQVAPKAIEIGTACGSSQILPCILSVLPEK